jgi:hypothetical protein
MNAEQVRAALAKIEAAPTSGPGWDRAAMQAAINGLEAQHRPTDHGSKTTAWFVSWAAEQLRGALAQGDH